MKKHDWERFPVRFENAAPTERETQRLWRTWVRALSQEEIQRRTEEGSAGKELLSYADVLKRMRRKPAVEMLTLSRWIRHPDERVLLALLTRYNHHLETGSPVSYLLLNERAKADAEREDYQWTPVLDVLYEHACMGNEMYGAWHDFQNTLQLKHEVRGSWRQNDPLGDWLEEHGVPEDAEDLLRFSSSSMRSAAAARTPGLSERMFSGMLDDAVLCRVVCGNASLTPEQQRRAEERAQRMLHWPGWGSTAPGMLKALVERGYPLAPESTEELVARATREDSSDPGAPVYARDALLADPALSPSVLTTLYQAWRDQYKDGWMKVLMHPNIPGEILREALLENPKDNSLRYRVSSHPVAIQDPELWALLRKSSAPQVLANLCKQMQGDDMLPLLRRLVKTAPQAALDFLEGAAQRPHLKNEDLLPLLSSSNSHIRLRATLLFSQQRTAESAGATHDPQQMRGTR